MEIWKDVKDYEGLYLISNLGKVKGVKSNIVLKYRQDKDGYYVVNLSKNSKKKTKKIHRLLAIAFMLNVENKKCVNHIDGDKKNNHLNNLEWVTVKENNDHAMKTGLWKNFGSDCYHSKFCDAEVIMIRNIFATNPDIGKPLTNELVAKWFGVNKNTIGNVRSRRTYNNI